MIAVWKSMKHSATTLTFTTHETTGSRENTVLLNEAVIAGWTGRDTAAVEAHIRELEAVGVRRPASTPIFYRVAAARITQASAIEVSGDASSGEVEFILVRDGGRLWLGVGSDHTDREFETHSVTVSKQMCDKPVARELWAMDEIADHFDQLRMRSYIVEDGREVLYQSGVVAAMLPPADLIRRYAGAAGLPDGGIMFCGTFAVLGGIRPAPRFRMEIEDPELGRTIGHAYDVLTLPIAG